MEWEGTGWGCVEKEKEKGKEKCNNTSLCTNLLLAYVKPTTTSYA